jgi:hypothetical protein
MTEESERISIVTVATHQSGYFGILQQSCGNGGLPLTVLGFGKKWRGMSMKINMLLEYLRGKEDSDIVVMVDAFDVAMLGNKKELIERYLSLGKPIVVGVEAKNGWLKWLACKLYFGTYCGNIINAGGFMGRAKELRFMIETACRDTGSLDMNDQSMIMNTARKEGDWFRDNVALDLERHIFFNAACDSFLSHFISSYPTGIGLELSRKLLITKQNIQPIFLHGPFNIDLSPYLQKVGYSSAKPPDTVGYVESIFSNYTKTILGWSALFVLGAVGVSKIFLF